MLGCFPGFFAKTRQAPGQLPPRTTSHLLFGWNHGQLFPQSQLWKSFDYSSRTPFKLCIGSCFHLPSQVLVETEFFIMQRDKQVHFRGCAGLRWSCSGRIRMANRGTRLRARHRTNTYRRPRRMGSYDRRICPRSGGPSAACGRRRRKTRTPRTAPRC